jgi:hypothetical protein
MSFIDLFRPKWRHSDVDVRTEAVRNLGPEQVDVLVKVAREDKDARVRRIAVKRLEDAAVLEDLAARDPDAGIRELAADKAADLLVTAAVAGQAAALARLKRDRDLGEVVRRAGDAELRQQALARIGDEKILLEIVRRGDGEVRAAALARVKHAGVLKEIALTEEHKGLAVAAVARVEDRAALEEIARHARAKAARAAARERLPEEAGDADRKAAAAPRAADKTRRARLLQLALAAEALAARHDLDDAAREMTDLRARFDEVESGTGDEAIEKRFDEAVKKLEARRQAEAQAKARAAEAAAKKAAEARRAATVKAAPPPPPPPVEKPAEQPPEPPAAPPLEGRLLALVLEGEKLAHGSRVSEERARDLEKRWAELHDPAAEGLDELRERYARATQMMNARLADEKALREARAAEARSKLERAIADVEKQVEGRNAKGGEGALRAALGVLKTPGGPEDLRAKLQQAVDRLRGRLGELREAESWRRFAAAPKLEELIKEAEALAQVIGEVEDKSRAPSLLRDLQARWKEAGPAPSDKHEQLWTRFKAASDQVYEKCKEHFAKLDEERAANLTKKEELAAQVEALAGSTEWKETGDKIKALQDQWKQIGPVPQDKADAVWRRFRAACDAFFGRRKENDHSRDSERAANLEKKVELAARVEALSTSTEWKDTAAQIKALQEEWQKIGPAPRAEADAVWKRFRAACDAFFDRRKAAFEKLDEERQTNLGKKLVLCEKVESLASAEDHEAALAEVKQVQAEWKTIGPVPKDQSDEIWRRFRTACDVIYAGPSQEEPLPPAAAGGGDASASGLSGFTNRLPLEGLLAGEGGGKKQQKKQKKAEKTES